MLGDVDRQQSTRNWLKRRIATAAPILPWVFDQKGVLKPPSGVTHVVLDTPGGLHGFELARVVMQADAIVIPVCNSLFDRDSAVGCHAELLSHPRISSGRCKLGVVGMRIDARTRGADLLRQWAQEHGMSFWGVLREAQVYVKTVENGLTLFDLPATNHEADLAQWQPILSQLAPVARLPLRPSATLQMPSDEHAQACAQHEYSQSSLQENLSTILPARAQALMPAQGTLVHGDRFTRAATPR